MFDVQASLFHTDLAPLFQPSNPTGFCRLQSPTSQGAGVMAAAPGEEASSEALLRDAVRRGELGQVTQLLDKVPHLLNADIDDGCSPLIEAAIVGQLEVARLLIDRGANVSAGNNLGQTALMLGCAWGHRGVAKFLLERGADVNQQDPQRMWSPLSNAVEHGRTSIVRLLLRHGVEVDARHDDGSTALYVACEMGHERVARVLLVEGGADPSIPGDGGLTPKEAARRAGHDKCVELIEWYEREVVERSFILHKARCVHDDLVTRERSPDAPLPVYLRERGAGGASASGGAVGEMLLPGVEILSMSLEATMVQRGVFGPPRVASEEAERSEVVWFVVKELPRELYTELMKGLWTRGLAPEKEEEGAGKRKREKEGEG